MLQRAGNPGPHPQPHQLRHQSRQSQHARVHQEGVSVARGSHPRHRRHHPSLRHRKPERRALCAQHPALLDQAVPVLHPRAGTLQEEGLMPAGRHRTARRLIRVRLLLRLHLLAQPCQQLQQGQAGSVTLYKTAQDAHGRNTLPRHERDDVESGIRRQDSVAHHVQPRAGRQRAAAGARLRLLHRGADHRGGHRLQEKELHHTRDCRHGRRLQVQSWTAAKGALPSAGAAGRRLPHSATAATLHRAHQPAPHQPARIHRPWRRSSAERRRGSRLHLSSLSSGTPLLRTRSRPRFRPS